VAVRGLNSAAAVQDMAMLAYARPRHASTNSMMHARSDTY